MLPNTGEDQCCLWTRRLQVSELLCTFLISPQCYDKAYDRVIKDILMLEAVQKRAARWIHSKWCPNTFTWSKTTEACLQELRWPSLARRRDYLCIAFLFDLLHQRYTLSFNSYCSFKSITYLRAHTLSLQTVNSSINSYRYSYFVNIPFLWNTLPADVVSLPTANQFRRSLRSYFFT